MLPWLTGTDVSLLSTRPLCPSCAVQRLDAGIAHTEVSLHAEGTEPMDHPACRWFGSESLVPDHDIHDVKVAQHHSMLSQIALSVKQDTRVCNQSSFPAACLTRAK